MAKRIITAIVVVLVLLGGYYTWARYRAENHVKNGDVLSADGSDVEMDAVPAAKSGPAPDKFAKNANSVSSSMSELQSQNNSVSGGSAPLSDSQSPNAPNGVAFAGTGKFQVYRQGNLTWRVNTENGSTCILFATNEEWRKPVVYNHGCGNS